MPSGPQRRETRAPHLSAAAVPVERALIARAQAMEDERDGETPMGHYQFLTQTAQQFRLLAEEMHWWV